MKPLFGPGLLAMVVAPPGVGKTEIAYGALAAAVDGLPFCGLETRRPRRVLLLSEMEPKTIQPALLALGLRRRARRAGLVGAVQRLRLRYLRPDGSPGHLIDVVHASDAYAPDDDGRRPQWADVIRATVPRLERGGYDLLIVDSLARWMGNDTSNAAMLDALGALRQVTRAGGGRAGAPPLRQGRPAALRAPGRERHPGRAGPVLVAGPAAGLQRPAARPPAGAGVCQAPLRRADPAAAPPRAGGRGPRRRPARATATACWTGRRVRRSTPHCWRRRSQGRGRPSPTSSGRVLEALYRAPGHLRPRRRSWPPRPGWIPTASGRPRSR